MFLMINTYFKQWLGWFTFRVSATCVFFPFWFLLPLAVGTDGWLRKKNRIEMKSFTPDLLRQSPSAFKCLWSQKSWNCQLGSLNGWYIQLTTMCSVPTIWWISQLLLWLVVEGCWWPPQHSESWLVSADQSLFSEFQTAATTSFVRVQCEVFQLDVQPQYTKFFPSCQRKQSTLVFLLPFLLTFFKAKSPTTRAFYFLIYSQSLTSPVRMKGYAGHQTGPALGEQICSPIHCHPWLCPTKGVKSMIMPTSQSHHKAQACYSSSHPVLSTW